MQHLDQLFLAVFERLAEDAFYKAADQDPFPIGLLEKVPDLNYTVGDGRMTGEVMEGEILCTVVPNPQIGDQIISNDQTYSIYRQPLRDPSQRVWRVHAIARGL